MEDKKKDIFFLTCEKYYIFELLILAAGMMGAYTYNLRGGVFCNAQTANVVLMGMAFGKGEVGRGFYYLIPIGAYILGTVVSEVLPSKVRKTGFMRWDTFLIGLEIGVLILVGFIPLSWPHQIVQITINFICSMQYNTFRQAQGITMATTFVTNHVRQVGVSLAAILRHRGDEAVREKGKRHLMMLTFFFLGALILTVFCAHLQEKVIWLAIIPLGFCFGTMLHADVRSERERLHQTPRGH